MAHLLRSALLPFGLVLAIGLTGCSNAASPASPSGGGSSTGQTGGSPTVGLTGVVSNLNLDARSFSLAARGGTRLIVADTSTVVWNQATNGQVRFSGLQNGQVVSIRGIDQTRYVLARSITISE
jgi:hypothetical protein